MSIYPSENELVYYGDMIELRASGGESYQWICTNQNTYLPSVCFPNFNTAIIKLKPLRDLNYNCIITDSLSNVITIPVTIKVVDKPMEVIDMDILPVYLENEILMRNKKGVIEKLKKNKSLLMKLIQFYNIQLQSSYKYVMQGKQGRGFRVPWITKYQITNEQPYYLLSYHQQYQFLRYLLQNQHPYSKSNFMYLINIVQYNFVLPSSLVTTKICSCDIALPK
jgi:hypothetical protein